MADYKLDWVSIITALLHDTVEDGVATRAEIRKLFGAEIARLVDGVTKLSKIEAPRMELREAENFRKFLLAMSKDIRVLLVKLADRLHNMRTLKYIESSDRRRRISKRNIRRLCSFSCKNRYAEYERGIRRYCICRVKYFYKKIIK